MPTVNVLFNDLQRLVGQKLPSNQIELNEILSYVKGELEVFDGDELAIEIKDGNRPDLWNVEGIARALRGILGIEEGLKEYHIVGDSGIETYVDKDLRRIRPYIGCSVVKGVKLDNEVIRELVHLQDKLDQTYGRRRKRSSIGLYNLDLIKPPIEYRSVKPTEISFTPLESEEEMNLKEILEKHPKGIEYGHTVEKFERWPILIDSKSEVLSFPPIINSNDLGRITEDIEDIFVEVTGTSYETVLNTLTLVTLSLADRGEQIYSTKVFYPYAFPSRDKGEDVTPHLKIKKIRLKDQYVKQILGLELDRKTILELLSKARFAVINSNKDSLEVIIPCYRMDIMHPVDVVEDLGIIYGYNKIEPRWPQMITFGRISDKEIFSDLVREIMIGLGCQEVLSFTLDSGENQKERMNLKELKLVKISNPKTLRFTNVRGWLLPSLMAFLGNNTHVEYPQKVFEVGDCVLFDTQTSSGVRDVRKVSFVTIHSSSNFSEAKSMLDALLLNIGFDYDIKTIQHPTFITGRVGRVVVFGEDVGLIGEISPSVLDKWNLENPAVAFELDLNALKEIISSKEKK
jgi:phenylalanyl-tRNA synthetase beta chain